MLGFVWGVGTISGSRLCISFHDEDLLSAIAEVLQTKAKPYHPTTGKTALRFSLSFPFAQRLLSLGWSGRFDKERKYPRGSFDEVEFVRGYCYTKASLDIVKPKGTPIMRLRIFGSLDVVCGIDNFLSAVFGMNPKKPQFYKTNKGTCYAVYYQSPKYILEIVKFLHIRN